MKGGRRKREKIVTFRAIRANYLQSRKYLNLLNYPQKMVSSYHTNQQTPTHSRHSRTHAVTEKSNFFRFITQIYVRDRSVLSAHHRRPDRRNLTPRDR